MKTFDDYQKKEMKDLKVRIKNHFEKSKEPLKLTYDVTMNSYDDLKKKSIQHTVRLVAKKVARKKFSEAKKSKMFMIVPESDGKIHGNIEVKKGVPLPIYSPEICEMKDLKLNMVIVGLLKHLTTKTEENREYYKELLTSLCPGVENAQLEIEYLELQKELKEYMNDKVSEVREGS